MGILWKKIKAYNCIDGTLFECKNEAKKHDKILALSKIMGEIIYKTNKKLLTL